MMGDTAFDSKEKMTEQALTKEEAQALLKMEKVPQPGIKPEPFPGLGGRIKVPLQAMNGREKFLFDITTKRIALTTSYQTRARQVYVLARLDFNAPHTNPDGTKIGVPHLHLYSEKYGDKVAYPVPEGLLSNPASKSAVLEDFMRFCNIKSCVIEIDLFGQ